MKLLIFVISLFIVAAQSKPKDLDWKGCMAEHGMNDDVKFGDPKSRCILACVFKKAGLIKDAKVVSNVAFDMAKEDTRSSSDKDTEEKVNMCIEKAHQEANECDVTYVFLDCLADGLIMPKKQVVNIK